MTNDQQIYRILHDRFGFTEFRDGQLETIRSIVTGHDTLAVLPTGGGKSLLYQLPAYLLPGAVLVISPLISLMQDQLNRLRLLGEKRVIVLNSQLVGENRQRALAHLNQFKFIFASPEILANPSIQFSLRQINISLMVIDEAHCISQWGPDFRPEYLVLKQIRQAFGQPPCLMVTATATAHVRTDIINKLGLMFNDVTQVIRSVNRSNIFLAKQIVTDEHEKAQSLLALVQALPKPGIIYFASRKQASQMADWLNQQTVLPVAAYHAGVADLERYRIQQEFMNNQLAVICATSAFGMGIDKKDIRFVIHYHLPANLENYVQEIGRAGRDGKNSIAVLMYRNGDEHIQERLITIDLPSSEVLDQVRLEHLNPQVLGEQAALFQFYLQHGYSGQQIIKAFQRRGALSSQRLAKMEHYIRTSGCLRYEIAHYFNEDYQAQEQCCSNDYPDWLEQWTNNQQQADFNQSVTSIAWQQRLAKIFKQPTN